MIRAVGSLVKRDAVKRHTFWGFEGGIMREPKKVNEETRLEAVHVLTSAAEKGINLEDVIPILEILSNDEDEAVCQAATRAVRKTKSSMSDSCR